MNKDSKKHWWLVHYFYVNERGIAVFDDVYISSNSSQITIKEINSVFSLVGYDGDINAVKYIGFMSKPNSTNHLMF